MNTDPISDMLTRIRNAKQRKHEAVDVPSSKVKLNIAEILRREGFIRGYKKVETEGHAAIRIYLKYIDEDRSVITDLKRVSTPGRRVYVSKDKIPNVRGGLGVAILSTSKGIMTDRESRKSQVGGELLCFVW
ncbi:MAG TPA: 30S ribosomal protein S8 [Nitrospiria bacterium]|nr:30S ribosomal protein S8 [Nitrospiria bacterium]